MAFKEKKAPKKPKASASIETKLGYLKKVREVDAYNKKVKRDKNRSKALDEQIKKALAKLKK